MVYFSIFSRVCDAAQQTNKRAEAQDLLTRYTPAMERVVVRWKRLRLSRLPELQAQER